VISLIEVSAGHQRDAHRLKIARSGGFIIEAHVLVFTRHVAVDEGIIREAIQDPFADRVLSCRMTVETQEHE